MKKKTIWADKSISDSQSIFQSYPQLSQNKDCDVLIIGGGLSGISTAYYLATSGKKVILLEAKTIGSGVTENTTAHITTQHDATFVRYIKRFGKRKAEQIAKANEEAIDSIASVINKEKIDCDFEKLDSYLFTNQKKNVKGIKKEFAAANRLGIDCELVNKQNLFPLPYKLALRFKNQAQFHPVKYLHGLANAAEKTGNLQIFENSRVIRIERGRAATDTATVSAKFIVMATHNPLVNFPGWFFAKMYSHRSYALAAENTPKIKGLWTSIDDDGHTFRQFKEHLIISGEDHKTGFKLKKDHVANLSNFCSDSFEGAKITNTWSAQDGITIDNLPYIGLYSKRSKNLFVITGFGKWGMTYSNIAGKTIRDYVLNDSNTKIKKGIFDPRRRKTPYAIWSLIRFNTAVLIHYIAGFFHIRNPRCPHMKCGLRWNKAEKSWDCPCHGSRFNEKGIIIDTPAIHKIMKLKK